MEILSSKFRSYPNRPDERYHKVFELPNSVAKVNEIWVENLRSNPRSSSPQSMELKRRSYLNLPKKLTVLMICLIVFILFNYICSDDQCYWRNTNSYNYSKNRFYRKVFNHTVDARPKQHSQTATNELKSTDRERPITLENSDNDDQLNRDFQTNLDDRSVELNKSDQLIGRRLIINLLEQASDSRLKYLNLINHSSTNQSLLNLNRVAYDQIRSGDKKFQFSLYKDDVLIFLHIQKVNTHNRFSVISRITN